MQLAVVHFVELQLCVRLLSDTSCRHYVHVLLALKVQLMEKSRDTRVKKIDPNLSVIYCINSQFIML